MKSPLRYLLLLPCASLLSGCPRPGAPLVGTKAYERVAYQRVLHTGPGTTAGASNVQIIEEKIDHYYDLLFSPDGDRKGQVLRRTVRYQIRYADGSVRRLTFLDGEADDSYTAQMAPLQRVGDQPYWVGCNPCGEDEHANGGPGLAVFVCRVFSETALLHSVRIEARKRPEYLPAVQALRYQSAEGERVVSLIGFGR